MDIDSDALDRDDVEQIACQAIARHFRLPALFSVVLMVVGFVLGHYVASSHFREATGRLEERIAALEQSRSAGLNSEDAPEPPVPLSASGAFEDPFADQPASSEPRFRLSGFQTFIEEGEGEEADVLPISAAPPAPLLPSPGIIVELRGILAEDRDACLAELAPYVERRLSLPAPTVAGVVETIFAEQDRRLEALVPQAAGASGLVSPSGGPEETSEFRPEENRTSDNKFPPIEATTDVPPGAAVGAPHGSAPTLPDYRFFPKPRTATTIYFSPSGRGSQGSRDQELGTRD